MGLAREPRRVRLDEMDRRAAIAFVSCAALGAAVYIGYRAYGAAFQNLWDRRARLSRGNVVDFLNYAYLLEIEQVRLYDRQSVAAAETGDEHFAAAMRRARDIEEGHALKISDYLKNLESSPAPWTRIGPPIGSAMHALLSLSGWARRETGRRAVLRSIVWIEQKAIDHYLRAIRQTDDEALKRMYMENLVDEEFHAAWAQEMLDQRLKPDEGDAF